MGTLANIIDRARRLESQIYGNRQAPHIIILLSMQSGSIDVFPSEDVSMDTFVYEYTNIQDSRSPREYIHHGVLSLNAMSVFSVFTGHLGQIFTR